MTEFEKRMMEMIVAAAPFVDRLNGDHVDGAIFVQLLEAIRSKSRRPTDEEVREFVDVAIDEEGRRARAAYASAFTSLYDLLDARDKESVDAIVGKLRGVCLQFICEDVDVGALHLLGASLMARA